MSKLIVASIYTPVMDSLLSHFFCLDYYLPAAITVHDIDPDLNLNNSYTCYLCLTFHIVLLTKFETEASVLDFST